MRITIERSPEYQDALKHLVLAQSSEDPLENLLTSRENLIKLVNEVRNVYVDQANDLLVKAGAKGDIEMVDLVSESEILGDESEEQEDDDEYEDKSKGTVGFQPNPTKVTGD